MQLYVRVCVFLYMLIRLRQFHQYKAQAREWTERGALIDDYTMRKSVLIYFRLRLV